MQERDNFYLTKEGLEQVKKEYEELKKLRDSKFKDDVPNPFESEDLNPDYTAFQEDVTLIESRLAELEMILHHASLIKPRKNSGDKIVDLGTRIDLTVNGTRAEYAIVGTLEADPVAGKISNESPVGRALIGKKEGDEVIIDSPKKTTYKIKKIHYS